MGDIRRRPSASLHGAAQDVTAWPAFTSGVREMRTAELELPEHSAHQATPGTDGLLAALFAAGYEIFLYKRLQGGDPVGPLEILAPAVGVGLSLAALMWWLEPGTTYMPWRKWLRLSMRLNHLLTIYSLNLQAVYVSKSPPANQLQDLVMMLFAPGWIITAFILAVAIPLPLLHTLVLNAIIVIMIPFEAQACCAISAYVDPLEGHFSAALSLLLRPTIMRPLRGRLGAIRSVGRCQTALVTVWSLVSLAGTACMSLKLWTQRQQHLMAMLSSQMAWELRASLWRGQSWKAGWLQLPCAARLLVYLVGLQLWVALALGGCSMVVH